MLGLVNGEGAEAIDNLMARTDTLGPVSKRIRKQRWDASAEYRKLWRLAAAVRLINELGKIIGSSFSKALHAAQVPHGDGLFHSIWGYSREDLEAEMEAASYLGGRMRGDLSEHEPMDRCLYNGQLRPGAIGPPASWHDEASDAVGNFNAVYTASRSTANENYNNMQ